MESILWTEAAEPRNTSLADVIYNIRREDPENLLMDSVTSADILSDADDVLMFDALVVPYQQLLRRMNIMRRLMNRAGTKLKVEEDTDEMKGMVISDPFKKNGAAQVAVTFNLEDGQTISIFFHNPDATPSKIAPGDDLISWKWLLNKKDVTIVVAPEHGKDLDVHEVSRRIMKLADKNSAAFARANAKKAERLQKIEEQESEITSLEAELAKAKAEFEEMQADADKQARRLAEVGEKYTAAEKRVTDLTKERDELKTKKEAEAAAKKAAEEKVAAEQASKKAGEGFPEIKSDKDFVAFFDKEDCEILRDDDPEIKHLESYLVTTGKTDFEADVTASGISTSDGGQGIGVGTAKTNETQKWRLDNGEWLLSTDGADFSPYGTAKAVAAFAEGVRNGSLKVLSGAGEVPAPEKKVEAAEDKFLFVNVGADGKSTVQTLGDVAKKAKEADSDEKMTADAPVAEKPAEDDEWAHDKAILEQIIAKTYPKMYEAGFSDEFMQYAKKYQGVEGKEPLMMKAYYAWEEVVTGAAFKAIEKEKKGGN